MPKGTVTLESRPAPRRPGVRSPRAARKPGRLPPEQVTRHLWALGVRDVIEASSIAEARPRIGNPRDICVADVHLPDGSGLSLLSETRAAGWPNGLALSAADDIGAVRNALAGGVKGYVVTGTRNNLGAMPTRHGAAPIGAAAARMHRRPGGGPGGPGHPGGQR